jgi:glyoxylase-like metal-dependent hydrolase (beta-lactamase superfamily II)
MLKLSSLSGNSQRLDGGAMFGNAPRALWSRWAAPDEFGRVALACRAFLVEDGDRRVLLETGIGAFFEPALRERYGVLEPQHVLLDSLSELGLDHSDIDFVVLSHLHFDHAGGLLAAHTAGEPPRLLFPRARYVVGKTAFERNLNPHLRDRASFIPELPGLLQASGRLDLVENERDLQRLLGEHWHGRETSGHTPGMLHAEVRGAQGSAFFCADLVPGSAWVHLPITMGYDRFPEQLIDEKAELFCDLEYRQSFLLFTHDPEFAAARIESDERSRYRPVSAQKTLSAWDLDATSEPPPKA